jgi:hypothetical protein
MFDWLPPPNVETTRLSARVVSHSLDVGNAPTPLPSYSLLSQEHKLCSHVAGVVIGLYYRETG